MTGRPHAKALALAEREKTLEELGLLGVYLVCPAPVKRQCDLCAWNGAGSCGKGDGCGIEDCGRPVIKGRVRCVAHRSQDITANQAVTSNEVLKEMRDYMTQTMLPKAVSAVNDVLDDEEAAPEVKLRASAMVMDRSNMPAGQQINVEQTVRVLPPEEMFRTAMEGVRDRMIASGILFVGPETPPETVPGSVLRAVPDEETPT